MVGSGHAGLAGDIDDVWLLGPQAMATTRVWAGGTGR